MVVGFVKFISLVIVLQQCVDAGSQKVFSPYAVAGDDAHGCHFYNNKKDCIANKEGGESCYWCKSAAVPSTCYNETEKNLLPPAVFQCTRSSQDLDWQISKEPHPDQLKSWFDAWIVQYGKQYPSHFEYFVRMEIFRRNSAVVAAHNHAVLTSPKRISYTLSLNQFADTTWEEFKGYYLGISPQNCSATTISEINKLLRYNLHNAPPEMDWRKHGIVSPVKNQGHCGSCWTFSTTGCLESHHAKKSGKMVLLSEQNLIDCAGNYDNHGCSGGLPSHAFEYIRYNGGIDTEKAYPYHAKNERCHFTKSGVGATVMDVVNITSRDENELMTAVGTVGPVSIAFQVAPDFRFYKTGVYDSAKCKSGENDVNHAVLAVGYGLDSKSKQRFWIVKNSWGEKWGMDGYFKIARNKNMCGLADCASYPVVG